MPIIPKLFQELEFGFQMRLKKCFFIISLFIILLTIYLKTLLPTVSGWDTGEFQTITYSLDIAHPTGYPAYILLGKLFITIFPFFSVAWKMNFFSALCTITGCIVLFLLNYNLTKNHFCSFTSSLILGLNPTIWRTSLRADPHTLHLLFICIIFFLIFKMIHKKRIKLFPITCFLVGISLGNHMLTIFTLPAVFLTLTTIFFANKNINKSLHITLLSLFVLLLGLSVYILLPILGTIKKPLTTNYQINNFQNFKRHVLGQDFQGFVKGWVKGDFLLSLKYYLSVHSVYFPILVSLTALIGFLILFYEKFKISFLFTITFFLTLIFSLKYPNADLERYFMVPFLIFIIWFNYGISFMNRFAKNLFPKKTYLNKLSLFFFCCLFLIPVIAFYSFNFRKNYFELDQSKNFHNLSHAYETFNNIDKNGIIISWWSPATPLWYLQKVEGIRKDVKIFLLSHYEWEEKIKQKIDNYPVYLVERIELESPNLKLKKINNVYKVIKRHETQ